MVDIISKHPDVNFKDLHTGGRNSFIGEDLPECSTSDGKESKYIRCKQCGFICNTDRDQEGSGYGNETNVAITTIAGGTANARLPVVGAGCPLCGSSEFK